jgi:ribosomal protein L12E/L44/L45/RPP1/RPP2
MKVQAEDLWPLILDFVETNFGEDDLESFKKYFGLKVDHKRDPIVKAGGLQAMLGVFLKNNKEVLKAFKTHLEAKEEEAGPKTAKKAAKKKAESSDESEEEEKPKKVVG